MHFAHLRRFHFILKLQRSINRCYVTDRHLQMTLCIGLFGENPGDRRNRLRELMLKSTTDAGVKHALETAMQTSEDEEEDNVCAQQHFFPYFVVVVVGTRLIFFLCNFDVNARRKCGTIKARRSS